MTNNRQKYSDSYNPVVDLPRRGQRRPTDERKELSDTQTPEVLPEKKKGPKGKRVRPSGQKKGNSPDSTGGRNRKTPETKTEFSVANIKDFLTGQTMRWLTGIVLGAFAAYLLVCFVSYFAHCIEDQASIINSGVGSLPKVGNSGGEGGARISEFLINGSFGLGSFVIILWLAAIASKLLSGWPRFKTVNFTIKCIVALITVSLIIGLLTLASDTPVNWGGYHGRYVNEFIVGFFGWTGGVILCVVLVAAFFIICLRDFVNWILRKKREIAERRREAQRIRQEQEELERELAEMRMREEIDAIRAGEAAAKPDESAEQDNENTLHFTGDEAAIDPSLDGYDLDDEPEEPRETRHADSSEAENVENPVAEYYSEDEAAEDANVNNAPASAVEVAGDFQVDPITGEVLSEMPDADCQSPDSPSEVSGVETEATIREESESGVKEDAIAAEKANPYSDAPDANESSSAETPMIVNVNQIAKAQDPTQSHGSIREMYKFPATELLRPGEHRVTVDIEEQQANKERIRETLLYHKIPITRIEATVGPTVTLYEIRPEQGVKISKIKNLADDIALSLAAKGVRVIAPIPGKGTVGIEVANAEPQTVSMRTIIESRKYAETRYRLPVALGSTIGNEVYIADLTKMPHLLVAGATGQGKSVGLNAIIASLLYKKRPDELKFVMIDPKEVEFSLYAKIESHYLAKLEDSDAIVTDMSKVVPTLQSLCVEMDNRYKLLRTAQVRNIEEYNSKIERNQLSPSEGHRFLPYIVLIVDEFADLIMTSGKEVETPIARLAQKARAIGIHVIIATQRPSTNVITGIIKANFPVRMAFRVSSGVDSKTILDTTGAQQLIGKGDMLISNNSEMVRVQCAFIDTPEVEEICEHIGRQPFNAGAYILPEPLMNEGGEGGVGGVSGPETLDPLFPEVADIVVTSGIGSTSGIQRRLSIGYNRAGKIMDQLEHYGVVGPSMGGKPRQVLMDAYGLQELLRTLNLI
ncbi:MAG: DNA translocase FtsK [Bacteroidales bacterium]|nr:DNA translocase FtsK [Bacteroidales bacterium]